MAEGKYYDFGVWGYHTNDSMGVMLPGFQAEQPGLEICGEYNLIFAAALIFDRDSQTARMRFRRQVKGWIAIKGSSVSCSVAILDRQKQPSNILAETIFSGDIYMNSNTQWFGTGYHFHGFADQSVVSNTYPFKASNAALIMTQRNNNLGRLLVVSETKAFRRTEFENGTMQEHPDMFESQLHETQEARRICKCRHFSWLCQDLGLPCGIASLITQFADDSPPPFIFAEPGDLWIDIRLSTPNRTYVLARRRDPSVPNDVAEFDGWW